MAPYYNGATEPDYNDEKDFLEAIIDKLAEECFREGSADEHMYTLLLTGQESTMHDERHEIQESIIRFSRKYPHMLFALHSMNGHVAQNNFYSNFYWNGNVQIKKVHVLWPKLKNRDWITLPEETSEPEEN